MAEIDEDVTENFDAKVSANQSLTFQRELKEEKELLQRMLTKIDTQIHGLQVEQLHLLGLINKSLNKAKGKSPPREPTDNNQQASTSKTLDLSVPPAYMFQEEMEDEDED